MAEFSAWIMFICAISRPSARRGDFSAQQFALPPQVLGALLEDVLEHQVSIKTWPVIHGAVAERFLPLDGHLLGELLGQTLVAFLRPFTEHDQVLLEALDRIAQGPALVFVPRPVAGRIVAGWMRRRAVGDEFDHRGPAPRAGTVRGPAGRGIDGEKIVAVDAQAGQPVGGPTGRE